MKNITKALLLVGVALCILQVWLPAYFLTGDGPCHLYNAQILHDLWCNKNSAFYSSFYKLVCQPNPNWLATLVLALLLFIVKGVIAEKIFLTAYIIIFTGGFYLLLKKISNNPYWLLILLLFVFPHTLAKGFYNFSFSIGFYFWMVWAWLRLLEEKTVVNVLLFFVFTGLLFFTHLLAFVFGAFTCAALIMSYALANTKELRRNFILKQAAYLFLFLLPFLILMNWFTQKEGGMQVQIRLHLYRIIELLEFKYLVNVRHTEELFAEIVGVILLLLFAISFLRIKKDFVINKYDGFLVSLVLILFVYLFFPEAFLGRLILISMRAQQFVYILICCCIAYRFPTGEISKKESLIVVGCFLFMSTACISYLLFIYAGMAGHTAALRQHIIVSSVALSIVIILTVCTVIFKLSFEKIRNGGLFILSACFVCLFIARLSCLLAASTAVSDYLSAGKYIKPYKVVLPLDFSPGGKYLHGGEIADRNFLFVHAAQYMGTEKPLIILDNYEANMGYFPINWKDQTNPYFHLSKKEGIEAVPAYADIKSYKEVSGVNIDYILMWCYDTTFLQNMHFPRLYSEIQKGYHIVYISPTQQTILYALNSGNE